MKKKLFLISIFILFFAFTAFSQPTNPESGKLAIDPYNLSIIQYFDIQDFEVSVPEVQRLAEDMETYVIVFDLINADPGPHSYRVRAFGKETVVTLPDGTIEVTPAVYSGFSNTLNIFIPQILDLNVVDGYLVTTPQEGITSTKVYIEQDSSVGTYYTGLAELSPDNQYLRIYDISAFSPGEYNIWANAKWSDGISEVEGNYQQNPTVVRVKAAPPTPAIQGLTQ